MLLRYWPELQQKYPDLNIYLTSNKKPFTHSRIKNIQIEDDKNWSDSLRVAVNQIEEDYILVMLEDYLVHVPVNDKRFWDSFAFMKDNNAGYMQVSYQVVGADPDIKYPYNIVQKQHNAEYRTSLQAAIWEKETLLNILLSGENPWGFEIAGSVRSESIAKPFLGISKDFPINYLNAVDKGYIDDHIMSYLKENEYIDLAATKLVLRDKNSILYKIKFYKKYFKILAYGIPIALIVAYIMYRRRRVYRELSQSY